MNQFTESLLHSLAYMLGEFCRALFITGAIVTLVPSNLPITYWRLLMIVFGAMCVTKVIATSLYKLLQKFI